MISNDNDDDQRFKVVSLVVEAHSSGRRSMYLGLITNLLYLVCLLVSTIDCVVGRRGINEFKLD